MNLRTPVVSAAVAALALLASSCTIALGEPDQDGTVATPSPIATSDAPADPAAADTPPAAIGDYTRFPAREGSTATIWSPGTSFLSTEDLEAELGLDVSSFTQDAAYKAATAYATLLPIAQETGDYTYLTALSTANCEFCLGIINEMFMFAETGHDRMGTRLTVDSTQAQVDIGDGNGVVVFQYSETYGIVVDENGTVLADGGQSAPAWLIAGVEHDGFQWRVSSVQVSPLSSEEQAVIVD